MDRSKLRIVLEGVHCLCCGSRKSVENGQRPDQSSSFAILPMSSGTVMHDSEYRLAVHIHQGKVNHVRYRIYGNHMRVQRQK